MDHLFAARNRGSRAPRAELYGKVQTVAGQMRGELKEMIGEVSPGEYLAARKFLDGLAYEAQFQPQPRGVAQR
jgi:hypothetical protein